MEVMSCNLWSEYVEKLTRATAELRLPAVDGGLDDAIGARQVRHQGAGFMLLRDLDDLFFRITL